MDHLPPPQNPTTQNPTPSSQPLHIDLTMASTIEHLVTALCDPLRRETALFLLEKKIKIKENIEDLGPLLWNSGGTVAALLQEVISVYHCLSDPELTLATSSRVRTAITLLQHIAVHPSTKMLFLDAYIPLYLYPFLYTTIKSKPFDDLRATSLGVIGALLMVDKPGVVHFLLKSEITPCLLRAIEMGSDISRLAATFILQKILADEEGLQYICLTPERFFAVCGFLQMMVESLPGEKDLSERLLPFIICCYLRLSENPKACESLSCCLPEVLRDATLTTCLRDDWTKRWLQKLLSNVSRGYQPQARRCDHMR